MMQERTEDTRAAGLPLVIVIGGRQHELPVLTIDKSRVWKKLLGEKLGVVFSEFDDLSALLKGGGLLGIAGDIIEELVLAYDTTHQLGAKRDLEKRATDQEIYRALRQIVEATFPFVRDVAGWMSLSGQLPQASSTNGPLPNGGSIQPPSPPALPTSN